MTEFLKEMTKSTAVYIGKLETPKRPIEEDDDDKAHIDEEAAKVIKFYHATSGHDFLVGKYLK
jgi:hypothetical protein